MFMLMEVSDQFRGHIIHHYIRWWLYAIRQLGRIAIFWNIRAHIYLLWRATHVYYICGKMSSFFGWVANSNSIFKFARIFFERCFSLGKFWNFKIRQKVVKNGGGVKVSILLMKHGSKIGIFWNSVILPIPLN